MLIIEAWYLLSRKNVGVPTVIVLRRGKKDSRVEWDLPRSWPNKAQ